ncbi:MAG: hypothetical protein E7324_04000 [Clostridiales bacterium]|nr:hypothetical protein [Clostridiales bacterium]
MPSENEHFHYTYSAREQAEIKRIREKYLPRSAPQPDKMQRLRALDEKVEQKAVMYALIAGVTGALLLGTGMSLIMTELGVWLGLSALLCWLLGLVFGLLGLVLVCLAYPIHRRVLGRGRRVAAPQILQLTEELMK